MAVKFIRHLKKTRQEKSIATDLWAAIDLGSNSFRLQISKNVGEQFYPVDDIKKSVRLASGITEDNRLSPIRIQEAAMVLSVFGERIRSLSKFQVRAVSTNTLRVIKNSSEVLRIFEKSLGFPIEIISGTEEARLIYLGVFHTIPDMQETSQLVVDIGGGSTEFIIGKGMDLSLTESVEMGCVSATKNFFSTNEITNKKMIFAELEYSRQTQIIQQAYLNSGCQRVIATSGTARAIAMILEDNDLNAPPDVKGITNIGLKKLKNMLIEARCIKDLDIKSLKPDRVPVLAGGIAVMSAIFQTLNIEHMIISSGALRLGVLYDLLGRYQEGDMRQATVINFMQRYGVDTRQADRVRKTALSIWSSIEAEKYHKKGKSDHDLYLLSWGSALHEIGASISHVAYQKHSAYIIENADMPGFSRSEQLHLSQVVLAHRKTLKHCTRYLRRIDYRKMILAIRLAAIFHRARDEEQVPEFMIRLSKKSIRINLDMNWLDRMPLTKLSFIREIKYWGEVGYDLHFPKPLTVGQEEI